LLFQQSVVLDEDQALKVSSSVKTPGIVKKTNEARVRIEETPHEVLEPETCGGRSCCSFF